ncbi:MAG: aminomethyl-transferring glycine dehydrogenase [Deltaproteobacteria bacterium]|nr:aminomethyl-transferring glycine dehydrogenase [Deltaproteobacteria bacterium]
MKETTPHLASAADVSSTSDPLGPFARRHLGPRAGDVEAMLVELGYSSLDALCDEAVPQAIRLKEAMALDHLPSELSSQPQGEFELLEGLKTLMSENRVMRSCIGMGFSDTIVPPIIQRNILENPGWYTQYTPYQAEISQGRLEALLTFQTAISDLTGLPLCNSSLLDEASAAAEAMAMCRSATNRKKPGFFVSSDCHPQTIGVVRTRAKGIGLTLHVGPVEDIDYAAMELCGVLLQYPATDGAIIDPSSVVESAHAAGALVVVACDLLSLVMLKPPGEFDADIAVGLTQRFGVPMGFGGPHAAFLATQKKYARKLPGRLVGISRDRHEQPAYRLALQTREQHIRRDKATSNICTAQVLLAIMAGMYTVYHGPDGLRRIASRIHDHASALALGLRELGFELGDRPFFDTLRVRGVSSGAEIVAAAVRRGINLRLYEDDSVGIALDETTDTEDLRNILAAFGGGDPTTHDLVDLFTRADAVVPETFVRTSHFMRHEVFHRYRSETEMLRYIHRLESKDLSLNTSMIPLGSCTMKLNPTSAMLPVSWPEVGRMHPYAPEEQTRGYAALFAQLESWLASITGLPAVSLQPNAGSQGEFAGLLAIRRYHESRGEHERNICLIPVSAHGTNAASAAIAGFECVSVACDANGNVDLDDALMITYPSTHGVFELPIQQICQVVHQAGGQVYMDGANMNAQVGLTSPGLIGADVCHLNLHKTFSIPHGGGGPGMGPIAAREHLRPFLPGDPINGVGAVSASQYGSSSILPISWVYIALMGARGLKAATQIAILNANYMAQRLADDYDVLFRGPGGMVAHEFIIDCRGFESSSGVVVEDIAKRLMDYGFHAPTMSFPVPGTLMIEPTESESRDELDRFCDALISIRNEIRAIEAAELDRTDNPLKNAPHTAREVTADDWSHGYSRQLAAYPTAWTREFKYWPPVARIDNAWGDRNLACTHPNTNKTESTD